MSDESPTSAVLLLAAFLLFILPSFAGHTCLGNLWARQPCAPLPISADWLTDVLTFGCGGGGDGVGMSPKCHGSEEGVHSIRSIWTQDLPWCFPVPEVLLTSMKGNSFGCPALCWNFRVLDSTALNTERRLPRLVRTLTSGSACYILGLFSEDEVCVLTHGVSVTFSCGLPVCIRPSDSPQLPLRTVFHPGALAG